MLSGDSLTPLAHAYIDNVQNVKKWYLNLIYVHMCYLVWTVRKFSGIVVVFVETIHTENNLANNTRGNRLRRISS